MINPQLETFISVATLGSFSKAGDSLFISSTFDEYDFAGKTIIPFNTHGGSGN